MARETAVERWTVGELHAAVSGGRFWQEMRELRDRARWTYLVVEGRSLVDVAPDADGLRESWLAVTELGVTILHAQDAEDAERWLAKVAERRGARRAELPPEPVRPRAPSRIEQAAGIVSLIREAARRAT
jgi:ERCC4-type nuclease